MFILRFTRRMCLFASVFLAVNLHNISDAQILTEDLVGYWPLNGNGNDESGNAHHAYLVSGARWVDHGWVNGAAEVDGSGGHIVVDSSFGLTTDKITVIARIKGWKTIDWSGIVVGRGDLWVEGSAPLWMGVAANNTLTYAWNNGSAQTWNWQEAPKIPQDRWALVAIAIEPTKATSYVYHRETGRLDIGINAIPHIEQTVTHLKFGWDECCGGDRYFKGLIDEVMIYNRVLNADEIKRLATVGIRSSAILSFATPPTVRVGERFTVNINLQQAAELAGAQFNLSFNPNILKVSDVQEGEFLSKDGTRLFFQVKNIDNINGHLNGINIARLKGDGVSGNGTLLKIVFTAKAPGESTFAIENAKFGNSAGQALPYQLSDGRVKVETVPDVTGDGKVDILDLVLITRHFGTVSAASQALDINGDGDIDILDLILVTRHLGT